MGSRPFGTTGFDISEIALGTWQFGGSRGSMTNDEAYGAIEATFGAGVDLLDTADVYGDGDNGRRIGDVLTDRDDDVTATTKAGWRLDPHEADDYNRGNLERFVCRSWDNLDVDSFGLVQLHCPLREMYCQSKVFDALLELRDVGRIDHYGVSVEEAEGGLKAIEYDGVETVQVIFSLLR